VRYRKNVLPGKVLTIPSENPIREFGISQSRWQTITRSSVEKVTETQGLKVVLAGAGGRPTENHFFGREGASPYEILLFGFHG